MKYVIEISMDNAAFGDYPEQEAGRILRNLADTVRRCGLRTQPQDLRDINGNKVGVVKLIRYESDDNDPARGCEFYNGTCSGTECPPFAYCHKEDNPGHIA